MSKKLVVVFIVIVAAVGAGAYWYSRSGAVAPVVTEAAWTHSVGVGETVSHPDGMTLKLVRINDSRCKKDVVCIWAGELGVTAQASGGSFGSTTAEVVLGQTTRPSATVGAYVFTLNTIDEQRVTISVKK